MAARSWSWLAWNPPINKTTVPLGLSGTDVCACVMYKSWQLMKATQSCSGKFVRLHNALVEMSQESQGLGVWREDHQGCFFQKKGVSTRAACKAPRLGSGSCLQPSPAWERGWCAGSSWRGVFTRTCCLVAQIISVFWLLRGIWPLGFAFSFIYFCPFSILFVNTNILSHPEWFLPSLKIPSSSPSTACRLVPAPASPFALCCTYLALSIPSLLNSCSSGTWVPSVLCTICVLHLISSALSHMFPSIWDMVRGYSLSQCYSSSA